MYTVVGDPRNRTRRVMWMLEELAQPYRLEIAEPQSDRLRAVNFTGKAPALLVEGTALGDSVAIVTFLADRHGALTHPAGTLERARQDGATQFIVDELEGACWTAAKNRFLHPEDKRADVEPTCRFEWDMALERLDCRLGDAPHLAGEDFTIPDLLAGHTLRWGMKMFGWPAPEGRLAAYHARISDRPAMAAAIERGRQALAAAS
ncbi:glutathione S-transferase [Albimonas donghaensis]|uniref:Glutathione S-transferase n=1 Tax=Albimonas donghaensis TaxID=356660 RepID=A0A1H2TQ58_9RHOB|nr:glutathione S-transferase family protein [Albimonas donghaensis]SDW46001.1 glutathione S-transferase [Albimonas donghaensis]